MDRLPRSHGLARGRIGLLAIAWLIGLATGSPVFGQPFGSGEPPLAGAPAAPQTAPFVPAQATVPSTEPQDPPAPLVTLRVRVPAQISSTEELKYRLVVDNPSRAPAHHVQVRERLPRNVQFMRATPEAKVQGQDLTWDLGTLAPQAHKEIVVEVKPDGTGDIESSAFVQFEHGQMVRTRLLRPDLRLRVQAPRYVRHPDPIPFQIEVTNSGPSRLVDVVLKDELPAELKFSDSKPSTSGENPLTWKLGTLGPGETRRVQFWAIAPQPGTFHDQAEVSAGSVRQQSRAEVVVGEAKMEVAQAGPMRRAVGRAAAYRITVRNAGTVPLGGVQITDAVPRQMTFLRADSAGRLEGNQVIWQLGELKPGERRTVQMEMQAREGGKLLNVAQITAEGGLSQRSKPAVTEFEPATGPVVEIDRGDDPLSVGARSVCRVRVFNAGPSPVGQAALTVSVLDHLKIVAARGMTGGKIEGTVVRFEPLPSLTPGMVAEYTLEVQAIKPGATDLRADLQTAPGGPLRTWQESLTIEPAPASQ
jgi:uncharacterized repeat protein (TIGR01451 family)